MIFDKVCIIGFGLIGSSIARGIKENNLAKHIVAADKDPDVCKLAIKLKIADSANTDLRKAVEGCDLVIMCVPVGACGDVAQKIQYSLEKNTILTDVGSVKGSVIKKVTPFVSETTHFVPAHPIAGTEHSGPESGFAELFHGRWCILTPLAETDIKAVEKVTKLWEALGSTIEIMSARRHDLVLGITSHLPHLIAYTIVGTATDLEDDTKEDVVKFSASGFRDFTRIAASDPVMWRDVFLNNKEAVLEILQRFTEDLTELQKAIRKENGEFLEEMFTRTRGVRREIIQAGQADYARPNEDEEDVPPVEALKKASGSEV